MVNGVIAALTVAIILLSGLYPSFVLSGFQPVTSLKSSNAGGFARGFTLRKGLVVSQFAISQILIVGTLVVANQMDYFENRDLGFNKDAVISIAVPDGTKGEVLRQQLVNNPGVQQISFSSGAPSYANSAAGFSAPAYGVTKDDVTNVMFVDENYTDMFGLKMLAGEKIGRLPKTDTSFKFVVNETLVHKLGIMDPRKAVGVHITLNGRDATIIGVVHDFQEESKHKKIRACVLMYQAQYFFTACIKIQPAGMTKTIENIGKSWSKLFPDDLFQYQFLDEHIASFYTQEQKVYTAFKLFSGIAILIGCLGLYGLIAFAAAQRTKEVGIRKVLGAPMMSIVGLFSKEFIILIAIAFAIAAPIAWYYMHQWLQDYVYRINISWWLFVAGGLVAIIIALATISFQAIKAALANPVKSLRSE